MTRRDLGPLDAIRKVADGLGYGAMLLCQLGVDSRELPAHAFEDGLVFFFRPFPYLGLAPRVSAEYFFSSGVVLAERNALLGMDGDGRFATGGAVGVWVMTDKRHGDNLPGFFTVVSIP